MGRLWGGICTLSLMGCGVSDRALTGIPLVFEGGAEAQGVLAPAPGVEIRLTEARVTIADLQMESPTEAARVAPSRGPLPHPGHEGSGDVGGELLGVFTLDLLGGPALLGEASLYEGAYATASLGVEASPGALFRGVALVEGVERAFDFEVPASGRVGGIPFEILLDGADPPEALTLRVDVAHALAFADWGAPDGDGDGILTLNDGDFGVTLPFGVLSTPTWTLEPTSGSGL